MVFMQNIFRNTAPRHVITTIALYLLNAETVAIYLVNYILNRSTFVDFSL
jgi:hypothetical protein